MLSSYQSITRPAPPKEPANAPKKPLFAVIASLAALSLVGFVLHAHSGAEDVERAFAVEPMAEECQKFSGDLAEGDELFETSILSSMTVEFGFYMKNSKRPDEEVGILQIGEGSDMWPRLAFQPVGSSNQGLLLVSFGKSGQSDVAQSSKAVFQLGSHAFRVEVQGLQCAVYVDHKLQDEFSIPESLAPSASSLVAFAAGVWNMEKAYKREISSISVCASGDPYAGAASATTAPPSRAATSTTAPSGAPTRRPTLSPTPSPTGPPTLTEGCQAWRNSAGARLTSDSIVFNTPVRSYLEVSFKLTIFAWNTADSSGQNILRIGRHNHERAPGFYLNKGSSGKVWVYFNSRAAGCCGVKEGFDAELQVEYEVKVVMDGLSARVYWDGSLKKSLELAQERRFYAEDVPVYVADDYHKTADAVVTDLRVCSMDQVCQTWDNAAGEELQRDNIVLHTAVPSSLDLSFKMRVNAWNTQDKSGQCILRIGEDNNNRAPGFYLNKGTSGKVWIYYKRDGSQEKVSFGAELSTDYEVRVLLEGQTALVYWDGALKKTWALSSDHRLYAEDAPLYVSDDYHVAADAVVSGLEVCASRCQSWSNEQGATVTRDNIVFYTPVRDNMVLSFRLKLNAWNTADKSGQCILRIGPSNSKRAPGFYLNKGTSGKVWVYFKNSSTDKASFDAQLGVEYEVRVEVNFLTAYVYWDGELVKTWALDENLRFYDDYAPVYVSDDYHVAANAVVTDLKVCAY